MSKLLITSPIKINMHYLVWELNFIYCGLFVLILVFFFFFFVLFLLSLRFGQISPLTFFRWLLGIRLQDSSFLSEVTVNHLKKARGEIWPKRSERRKKLKYQDEDKKSAINKN